MISSDRAVSKTATVLADCRLVFVIYRHDHRHHQCQTYSAKYWI